MKKTYQNFWGAKCGQTTPLWWEIWGSKKPKVSCTKLERNGTDIVACRNTCGTNLLLTCFKYVIILEKYEKNTQSFSNFQFFGVIELLFKFLSIYSMAQNYIWCIIRCRYYTNFKKYIVSHSKYNRFIPS